MSCSRLAGANPADVAVAVAAVCTACKSVLMTVAAIVVVTVVVSMIAIWAVHMRFGGHRNRCFGFGFGLGVVRMPTCAVSATFRLKRFADLMNDQMHGPQQIGQHMVRLDFQMVRFEFNRHMPVAPVVRSAGQVKRRTMLRASGDAQHVLRRRDDLDHAAVFSHQHVAAAHQRAAWQENA